MRIVTIILVIALVPVAVMPQDQPWNEKGRLYTSMNVWGNAGPTPFDYTYWLDSVQVKYGYLPELIIWDDVQDTSYVTVGVRFSYAPWRLYPGEPSDSVWWMDGLTWQQIQSYLIGIRETVATGDTVHFLLPPNGGEVTTEEPGTYSALAPHIPVGQMPVPNDDKLYRFWVVPTGNHLPWEMSIDTLYAVRMTHHTALDSMYWLYRHWNDAPQEMFVRMLADFPDDTRLLRYFFWTYYQNANCDSLSRVGNHLIDVWQNGMSFYMLDHMANFDRNQAIRDIQQHIEHICSGGQPEAEPKGLGWSEQ